MKGVQNTQYAYYAQYSLTHNNVCTHYTQNNPNNNIYDINYINIFVI